MTINKNQNIMKQKAITLTTVILLSILCFSFIQTYSQSIMWQKCLGGSFVDEAYSIQQTIDGGYIVVGYTLSTDGDVTGNHGLSDYWLVKLNNLGTLQWQKCLGGTGSEYVSTVKETSDGGYIVVGQSDSNNGDVSGNHGGSDYWIVKTDNNGVLQWQKCLGGTGTESAFDIQLTTDGGYIITGDSDSNDGDVTGNHGGSDYWIVKLDNLGILQWQKSIGGSGYDNSTSIQQTNDGGYIVAGYTESMDGDVTGNHGGKDMWIVKLDNLGNIQWQKCFGGSNWEMAFSIDQTLDGGYAIAGKTNSNDGDVSGLKGYNDFWVVKTDNLGNLQWQKCLGGTESESANFIQQTSDTGYIVTGYTTSVDGDVIGNHGQADSWVTKLDSMGILQWQKCLGGTLWDVAKECQQISESNYIIAGASESNDGDVSGGHGFNDYWIVSLQTGSIPTQSIDLYLGWNIGSFNVIPDPLSMDTIFNPLIVESSLVKIIDESGGFMQEIPGIGWVNTIGNMANTEGYYIKVNQNTQLSLSGLNVDLPFDIPLTAGWNIIGYPLEDTINAIDNLQPIIDSSFLIKVIDESGGLVQNFPGVGWLNTIGDFTPGEGYYVKVVENCTLTLGIKTPTVFTNSVTYITQATATCGGNITSNGGAAVSARGVCWSTSSNPTLANNYTADGSGIGTFVSSMTGLTPNTTYYVRAYATNSKGTSYGNENSFTTSSYLPSVITDNATNITTTTATSGGNVTSNGGSSVTARGVCWSTSQNPTLANNYTTDGTGTGTFVSNISGLTPNTQYYIRAYATNTDGTEYGNEVSFTSSITSWQCGDLLVDDRDGQSYVTISIGSQCWFAENLNFNMSGAYWYNNSSANGNVYGRLYNWNISSSACPSGWNLPTETEWGILIDYLGGAAVAGGKMKEIGTTHWDSPNTGASNSSGFTALPGGIRWGEFSYSDLGSKGEWWSSSESSGLGINLSLNYDVASANLTSSSKNLGFSVRCLKNTSVTNLPPSQPNNPVPTDNAQNQPISVNLQWSCSDPEGDPLTYDVYFGTDTNPVLVSSAISDTTYNPGTLDYDSTYYWKIVAHDDQGNTTEGDVWQFSTETQSPSWQCGDTIVDPRDNQSYNTVQIGTQCWMAKNLNVGIRIDGANDQSDNGIIEKYCFEDAPANCDIYGGLYQWYEMMEYVTTEGTQGICPNGWHLPSDNEWKILEMALGMSQSEADDTGWRGIDEGGKMKETGTTHWNSPNTGATNSSGFTAIPGGFRYSNGPFTTLGERNCLWSSTEYSVTLAWDRGLWSDYAQVIRERPYKTVGFSVRCLKD